MKSFKSLNEVKEIIEPSTHPNTLSLWHGGNLDDAYEEVTNSFSMIAN